MKYLITESQVSLMKELMSNMLERDSISWKVIHYQYQEMVVRDGNDRLIFAYETNIPDFDKYSDVLTVSYRLIEVIESFFPLMDEYYIGEWFEKKYKRKVDRVEIRERDIY